MLGIRIAALRNDLGWSQAELARRLHISPSAVGMYEQGRREPSVEMLQSLSQVLGVTIDFLITGRAVSRSDFRTSGAMHMGGQSILEALQVLTREELLVLVTAELLGSEIESMI